MASNPNPYAFQDNSLLLKTYGELRSLIQSRVGIALQMSDGTDASGDVRSDYAKDIIAQARDILLARGEIFTEADRKLLPFLSWTSTPPDSRPASGLDASQLQLNKTYPDGFGAPTDPARSSAASLRQAALARESAVQAAKNPNEA